MVNMHVDFDKVWTVEDVGIEAKHFFVITDDELKISLSAQRGSYQMVKFRDDNLKRVREKIFDISLIIPM